jgi:hypothetical protein
MYLGWLVSVLVLWPNIIFFKFLPANSSPEPQGGSKSSVMKLMEFLERIGQAGVFAVPFVYQTSIQTALQKISLSVMIVFLLVYYTAWLRFFLKGRKYVLLYAPLMGLPLPMAVSPIAYFLAASVFLSSWFLGAFTVVLAIGHIYISQVGFQRLVYQRPAD